MMGNAWTVGRLALVGSLLGLLGCSDGGSMGDGFDCPSKPVAYVFDMEASGLAVEAMTAAGFDVRALPLDRSPEDLRGLLLIGSDAADGSDYAAYVEAYRTGFHDFVDRANVLVQMGQGASAEPEVPFLPTTHSARRGGDTVDTAFVAQPESPLIAGLDLDDNALVWSGPELTRGGFEAEGGFEVVLTSAQGKPLLMEGAYGQGRIVLSALTGDRKADGDDDAARAAFASTFFANLHTHVHNVCLRRTPALQITPTMTAATFTPGSWKLAVLPDTQVYSLRFPGLFTAQTGWISANVEALDIRYVIHLGDIVNNNTAFEWARARDAMSLLDGRVPVALVPGNHDYGPSGDASTRESLLNEYFDFDTSAAMPTFGGAYEEGKLDNTFHLFSAGERDFIIIALEWGPRDEVIAWADQVMLDHPDRDGIFVTHAHLNYTNLRYDHTDTQHDQSYNPHEYATPGGVNDGEELWQKLLRHHRFVMALNGHVLKEGTGYLVSETDVGSRCHQMLSNYQTLDMGGQGWMRILEFLPDGQTVRVFTYSPLFDDFNRDPEHTFEFTL